MRSLRQWVEEFILHISRFNNFSKLLPVCGNGVFKNLNILNFSAAIGNIYAHVAPVNRGVNWAYFMFNSRFRKYFRYEQMTSFIFETIIEFSAAIRNVTAQLVLMNTGLTSTYVMLIWMLLWDPLTYLFHWRTRVLVFFIIIKVCRQSRKTFLFLFCFLLLFFFLLSYFSLPPPASRDFSVIYQPISMKFGMLIVLDETSRLNIFSSQ